MSPGKRLRNAARAAILLLALLALNTQMNGGGEYSSFFDDHGLELRDPSAGDSDGGSSSRLYKSDPDEGTELRGRQEVLSRKAYRLKHGEDWKAHRYLSPPPMGYFNLSCPFEWSKYSCAYMANGPAGGDIAQASTDHYRDNLGVIRDAMDKLARRNPGRETPKRILFAGDSLLRQVFIGIACNAWSLQANLIERAEIPWKDEWPCMKNAPCFINHGRHGGFDAASIRLVNGVELHFVPHGGYAEEETAEPDVLDRLRHEVSDLKSGMTFGQKTAMLPGGSDVDVLVYNVGIHGGAGVARRKLRNFATAVSKPVIERRRRTVRRLKEDGQDSKEARAGPKTVYVTTPAQHYNTPNGQWHFDMKTKEKQCVDSVPSNPRADLEKSLLRHGVNVDVLLDYDDLDLGRMHVQKGNDCSHYCMPGAPDVVGARLLEAILS